nr:PREDICTED: bcl-2-interacting killer-like [Equus przewalskii]
MIPGSSTTDAATITTNAREEMSQAGSLSRDLFLDTFLCEHVLEPEEVPGTIDLTDYVDRESSPDKRIVMDAAHLAQLPQMAMYSLAFPYNQTDVKGVFRSFIDSLTNLRENIRFGSFLTLRN